MARLKQWIWFSIQSHIGNTLDIYMKERIAQLLCSVLDFFCVHDDCVQWNSGRNSTGPTRSFFFSFKPARTDLASKLFAHFSTFVSNKQSSNINVIWLLNHHYSIHKTNALCQRINKALIAYPKYFTWSAFCLSAFFR